MSITLALAQVGPAANALAVATDVAIIVIAVTIVVLLVMGISLVRRVHRVLGELSGATRQSLAPVSDRARAISENVEFITQSVRADVQQLNGSVRALTDRLNLASDRMEERIEEFNALMEVVQDEAEDLFLGTASAVRGVREGARSITSPHERDRPRPSREPEQDPLARRRPTGYDPAASGEG